MPYIFQSNPQITPTIVETPYSSPTYEQVRWYLNSGNTRLEANGAVNESISRQDQRMRSILAVQASMAVVPLTEINTSEFALSRKAVRITCEERYIQGANQAVLIVATVGKGVEEECAKLYKRGEYIDALVVDAITSAALDNAIWEIKENLLRQIKHIKVGYSLFPGSHGLPVNFLLTIFELLKPEQNIGVKITESMLLIPVKSTAAIIPMGHKLAYPGLRENDCMLYAMGESPSHRLGKNY